jgi:hypothetical protein
LSAWVSWAIPWPETATSRLSGEFDLRFAVDWMRKNLSILLEVARRNGAQLPIADDALVDPFYGEVRAMGAIAGIFRACWRGSSRPSDSARHPAINRMAAIRASRR